MEASQYQETITSAPPETSTHPVITENLPSTSPEAPAAVEAAPEVKPPEDKWAKKFAALTRKEKQDRERYESRKAELQKETEALKADKEDLEKFKRDQFAYLEEKDPEAYKKWTQRKIQGIQGPTIDEKISELEKKISEKEAAEHQAKLEAVKRDQEQFYEQTQRSIAEFITASPDDYELINFEDKMNPGFGPALVYQVMLQFHENTKKETGSGKVLSYAEACEMAEKFLLNRETQRLTQVKKLKPATTTPESEKDSSFQQSLQKSPSAKTGTPKTLTNQMNSELPNRGERKLTMDESKERLARDFIKFK